MVYFCVFDVYCEGSAQCSKVKKQANKLNKPKNLSSEQLNVQRISFLVDRYNTFISSMAVVFLFLLFFKLLDHSTQ